MPKTILFLLAAIVLPYAGFMRADEPVPIIRGESNQPGEFCIRVGGELRGFTGYLHSSRPFTLQQAIEAAGGIGEWGGDIRIYSIPYPTKLIHINAYTKDAQVRDELLPNGAHVYVVTLGPRF
ncbi:MAG: hypothetical protein P4L99_05395 [Chthoniobacter sp.]|nr:hypothetical protein [Chthoniobacter sp.]